MRIDKFKILFLIIVDSFIFCFCTFSSNIIWSGDSNKNIESTETTTTNITETTAPMVQGNINFESTEKWNFFYKYPELFSKYNSYSDDNNRKNWISTVDKRTITATFKDDDDAKTKIKITIDIPVFDGEKATEINNTLQNNLSYKIKQYLDNEDGDLILYFDKIKYVEPYLRYQNDESLTFHLYCETFSRMSVSVEVNLTTYEIIVNALYNH